MSRYVVSGRMRRELSAGVNFSEEFRYIDESDSAEQAIEYRRNDLEQIGWTVISINAKEG